MSLDVNMLGERSYPDVVIESATFTDGTLRVVGEFDIVSFIDKPYIEGEGVLTVSSPEPDQVALWVDVEGAWQTASQCQMSELFVLMFTDEHIVVEGRNSQQQKLRLVFPKGHIEFEYH